uniref:Uncharacterized protein n=1 Tax=Cacopsylla melanoneura TaxID=428564 RepID=A0A8D8SL51_9HEMI
MLYVHILLYLLVFKWFFGCVIYLFWVLTTRYRIKGMVKVNGPNIKNSNYLYNLNQRPLTPFSRFCLSYLRKVCYQAGKLKEATFKKKKYITCPDILFLVFLCMCNALI